MTEAPWLGEMTAEERCAFVRLANLEAGIGLKRGTLTGRQWGDDNADRWVAAIRDAEQRATTKMREAAAQVAESYDYSDWGEEEPSGREIAAGIAFCIRALP